MIKKIAAGLLLITTFFCMPSAYAGEFIATAYDLSPQSCGKYPGHPSYGITASGHSLKGKTWQDRTVSADLRILPLGTKINIKFPAPYNYMDGIYTVRDTGGGVYGNHIDIFFGEYAHSEALRFGQRTVYVTRI